MKLWKYCTKEHYIEFLLSLNLITLDMPDDKKIKCLYSLCNNTTRHYKKFTIPKRNGSKRIILEPDPLLKNVQYNLLKNVINNMAVSDYATAYKKGSDILKNSLPHLCQKKVLKLDLEDFFGSITFQMVYTSVFSSLIYPPSVKAVLANICCYNEALPQGAATSAAISNIVMKPFDDYIGKWCRDRSISYTRYCDDMTFSGDFDEKILKNKVEGFLNTLGFVINEEKTRLVRGNRQQNVTGVVVNEKVQTTKEYRKKIRQEIHYCKTFGIKSHLDKLNKDKIEVPQYLQSLLGKINHILYINPYDAEFRQGKALVIKWMKENLNQPCS